MTGCWALPLFGCDPPQGEDKLDMQLTDATDAIDATDATDTMMN